MSCVPCEQNAIHGWWNDSLPKGHTHCRDCHLTFRANNTIGHCSACHETFAGRYAFDIHQVDTVPVCREPAKVANQANGQALVADERGVWHANRGYFVDGGPS